MLKVCLIQSYICPKIFRADKKSGTFSGNLSVTGRK